MRHKNLSLALLLALGLGGVLNAPAQAQPDPNAAPIGENPPNWDRGGGGRGGNRGGGFRQQLTPDQLRQLRVQQSELRSRIIRQQLTVAGFPDAALQTAVVNFYKEQDTSQVSLLEQWQKISQAVRVKTTPETQMATMLNDFRAAVEKEKVRRETAYKALEAQLELSQKPLLDALLMTMGITGDEAAIVGQTNGGGMGGIMNILGNMGMGGMGGGGAFGGRGNQPFGNAPGGFDIPVGGNGPGNGGPADAPPPPPPPEGDRPNVFF